MVVTVSGQAGSGVTLSGTGLSNDNELTFTSVDWATAQTVTVAATDDDVAEANETVTLAHAVASTDDAAYNALSDVSVSVTVTDNDSVGVSIDPTSLTVVEGSSVDYAVELTSEPAGDVVVTVSGQAGSGVALSGTSLSADDELTFTSVDWATAQTVTVAATDDDVAEANETVTLAHAVASTDDAAYNALSDVNVTVTVTDNDSVGVSIDPTSLTVTEGSSVDYAVKLTSEPAGDVVVTVSGQAGSGVALSGTGLSNDNKLTFTSVDWATAQTVTVAATDDDVAEANETVTLAHAVASTDDAAYNALSDVNVTVTVTDNDSVQDAVVPLDWALKPSDLSGGDQFRLLFTTHTGSRAPNSTDIDDYNTYVQSQANASSAHSAIKPYASGFRVVGSTATVDAINNTSTEWTNTNTGVPIYWLNGNKVADDYKDFYDGTWDDEANPTRRGGDVRFPTSGLVYTGSNE